MIVVEGPDGGGKSTLIEYLVKETGLEVAPRVVSKDAEAMTDLVKWTEANVKKGWQPLIFDRHRLFSEPIYGPILRPRLEPGFDNLEWFEPMLRQFYDCNPIVIYCLPSLKQVWSNVQHDPDNRVVASQDVTTRIWGAYFNKAITEYSLRDNTYLYDYTWELEEVMREQIALKILTTLRRKKL